jgi:hypothetical protein
MLPLCRQALFTFCHIPTSNLAAEWSILGDAIDYTDITRAAPAPCAHLVNAQFKAYSSGLNFSGCLFTLEDHCTPSCAILLEKVKGNLVFIGLKPSAAIKALWQIECLLPVMVLCR